MSSLINSQDSSKILVIAVLIALRTLLFSFVARRFLFYLMQKWKCPEQTLLKDYCENFVHLLSTQVFLLFVTCIYIKDLQLCLFSSLMVIFLSFLISSIQLVNPVDIDLVKSQCVKTSIGALWAHSAYNSYFRVLFQEWSTIVKEYETTGKQLSSKKLILICPLSCNIQGKLSDRFDNIELVRCDQVCECDQGANINRDYKNPLYKLGKEGNEIFITAQFPSSYGTLWEAQDILRRDIWLYHRECFISTLKELLKDHPCKILEYNDLDPVNREPLDIFIRRQLNLRKEN